jgi:hypothetical protein
MSKRNGKPQIIKTDAFFFIINEHQGQKHLINYNSFNQVSCTLDNIKENKRVGTHMHNFHDKNKSRQRIPSNDVLRIYHQNIYRLGNKTNTLIASLYPNFPHLLCNTEHHLK